MTPTPHLGCRGQFRLKNYFIFQLIFSQLSKYYILFIRYVAVGIHIYPLLLFSPLNLSFRDAKRFKCCDLARELEFLHLEVQLFENNRLIFT